jgi:crotonobetainyl-CoA:carnitine CoA-transferase CaiB-like acyl-CoA transferase
MGDHPTGTALFAAIMTGLYRREKTGKGGHVGTSLVANGMWMNAFYGQAAIMGAEVTIRPHRDFAPNAVANHYCAKDGRWFILAVLNEAKQAPALFEALGRPDILEDERFSTQEARRANSLALTKLMDEIIATQDWAYWKAKFEALGITYGQAAKMEDLLGDEQLRHAGAVVPGSPEFNAEWAIGTPVMVEGETKKTPGVAPTIGQHNEEVVASLGYTADQIATLKESGVLR